MTEISLEEKKNLQIDEKKSPILSEKETEITKAKQNIKQESDNLQNFIKNKVETKSVIQQTKDSLNTLSKDIKDNVIVDNPEAPLKKIFLNKKILREKLKIKSNVFDDFQKAKKILTESKDATIKGILSYPGADAYFLSIIREESQGKMVRNKSNNLYYGYGQISKVAEASVSARLHKKLDRTKGADNCMILIGYIAGCWDKLSPYVEEKDISKFSLMGFKSGVEGIRGKLKKLSKNGEKVSRATYIKTYNKDQESYYVRDVRRNFDKLTELATIKPPIETDLTKKDQKESY